MKIALIVEHADSTRGGAERYTMQLAAALTQRGHDVTVIAREAVAAPPGTKLVLLPARALNKTARYAQFLQLVDEHLRQTHYDISHAMMPVLHCDIYHPHAGLAAEAIERGHLKHSGTLRRHLSRISNQLHLRRRYFRSLERKLLESENPPVVVCVSELVKKEVKRHYPLPEDRLTVLFNAVDLEKLDPANIAPTRDKLRATHGIPSQKVIALFVAQNFRLKGLRFAMEAMSKLNDPGLLLMVLGKESPSFYVADARRLGISDQIIFAGTTPDMYPYYAAADFLLLPTMRDSCSLVVLEALGMGVPVISTKMNGACEIMENGRHGFVLDDPGDIAALAEAMRQMMNDTFRHQCAKQIRNLRQRLSFDEHVEKLLAIYARIQA